MNYWLLGYYPHLDEQPRWLQITSWNFFQKISNESVKIGDIVYIIGGDLGVFAWGYITQLSKNQYDEKTNIIISGGEIKYSLITSNELNGLLSFSYGNPAFLTKKQIKTLNSLISQSGNKYPILISEPQFILNTSADRDEDFHTEYKEVKPQNIANEAYEFAVAYRNKEGGSIYFGISDKDKTVVGMNLNSMERDKIKRSLENKLLSIQPPLSPNDDYSIDFHKVIDGQGNEISDLFVFELEVKCGSGVEHKTAGGKVYEKTYSGRRKKTILSELK